MNIDFETEQQKAREIVTGLDKNQLLEMLMLALEVRYGSPRHGQSEVAGRVHGR